MEPRQAFMQQRRNARQRGIEWLLSFDDWWSIWRESGHWESRGIARGQYVMARRGDAGPYSSGNVSIELATKNCRDQQHRQQLWKRKSPAEMAAFSRKMRAVASGHSNRGPVGWRWVSMDGESRRIRPEAVAAHLAEGWRIGRDAVRKILI